MSAAACSSSRCSSAPSRVLFQQPPPSRACSSPHLHAPLFAQSSGSVKSLSKAASELSLNASPSSPDLAAVEQSPRTVTGERLQQQPAAAAAAAVAPAAPRLHAAHTRARPAALRALHRALNAPGVLVSRPAARDIKIDGFSLGIAGTELIK